MSGDPLAMRNERVFCMGEGVTTKTRKPEKLARFGRNCLILTASKKEEKA